jgi:hypothetical protein
MSSPWGQVQAEALVLCDRGYVRVARPYGRAGAPGPTVLAHVSRQRPEVQAGLEIGEGSNKRPGSCSSGSQQWSPGELPPGLPGARLDGAEGEERHA